MFNRYVEDKIMGTWKEKRKNVIEDVLIYINNNSNSYILKGGTALMECYNLTRFSEDIDLDSKDKNSIFKIIDIFTKERHFSYRIAKSTDTVIRFMLNYGGKNEYGNKPLKIEISYRSPKLDNFTYINDICVYSIDKLAMLKAEAYLHRDKLRDLFDLTFIYNNSKNLLKDSTIDLIYDVVAYKGIGQFDYLVKNQQDDLIDIKKLEENFLIMCDSLNMLDNMRKDPDDRIVPRM